MTEVWVNGTHWNGCYEAQCECGSSWHGLAEPLTQQGWSPAPPIASAIAHVKWHHHGELLDLRWTDSFSSWLLNYWEREMLRQARAKREPIEHTSGVARPAPRTANTSARGGPIVPADLHTEVESRVGPSVHLGREA